MPAPRVAAIHDLSGFGRCSLTIVMPTLSAMGAQCCPVPTAYLSTHTGGFGANTFLDLTDQMGPVMDHWRSLGLTFDGVYTGFMGSEAQMALTGALIRAFRGDGLAVVDPVMGDHGRPYRTYTPAMCRAMGELAELADVIIPNRTEAAILLGEDYECLRPGGGLPAVGGAAEPGGAAERGPHRGLPDGGHPGGRLLRPGYRGGDLRRRAPGGQPVPRHRGPLRQRPHRGPGPGPGAHRGGRPGGGLRQPLRGPDGGAEPAGAGGRGL